MERDPAPEGGTKEASLSGRSRRIGRPRKAADEVRKPVSIRISEKVLRIARASGRGWQTRAAAAIEREFLGPAPKGERR